MAQTADHVVDCTPSPAVAAYTVPRLVHAPPRPVVASLSSHTAVSLRCENIPGMCFPGRRQKDNFAEPKPERDDKNAVGVEPAPSSARVACTHSTVLPPSAQASSETVMSAPRVAIIIYSLYGHITKRVSVP